MLSPLQDSPSRTCFLDSSDSELLLSFKTKNKKKSPKISLGDEKLESLIKYVASVNVDYEFRGLDFESNLVKLYMLFELKWPRYTAKIILNQ